jgi:hypothetical protein
MYDNVKPSQKERNVEIMIMISEILQTHTHCYIDSLICIHQMNLATWCKLENDQDIASHYLIEGSLEVKLPTIWTDEKQSRAEAERRGRLEERRSEEKEQEDRRYRCAKR